MTKAKTLIATQDTFTKTGRYVPRGAPLSSDEIDYHSKKSTNVTSAPAGLAEAGAVEVSAIAPTGPNPTAPQQIAPGTVQTVGGYYDRGVQIVGEVTRPEKERTRVLIADDDTTQGDLQKKLDDHGADRAAAEAATAQQGQ